MRRRYRRRLRVPAPPRSDAWCAVTASRWSAQSSCVVAATLALTSTSFRGADQAGLQPSHRPSPCRHWRPPLSTTATDSERACRSVRHRQAIVYLVSDEGQASRVAETFSNLVWDGHLYDTSRRTGRLTFTSWSPERPTTPSDAIAELNDADRVRSTGGHRPADRRPETRPLDRCKQRRDRDRIRVY